MQATATPQIEATPVKWRILDVWYPIFDVIAGGVYVEIRRNRRGEINYAVVLHERMVLSKTELDWNYEPIPKAAERAIAEAMQ